MMFAQQGGQGETQSRPFSPEEVAQLQEALGLVDWKAAQLDKLTRQLSELLAKGAVPRAYLQAHNEFAIALYSTQQAVLDAFRPLLPNLPPAPPFPPLFLSRQGTLNLGTANVLGPGDVVLYLQHPRSPAVPAPSGELGFWAVLGILGFAAIAGYTTHQIVDVVVRERTKRLAVKAVSDMYTLLIEQIRWRTLKVMEAADKCKKEDPKRSYAECVGVALGLVERTPVPPYKEILRAIDPPKSRSWLWWIGLGAVLLVGGGVGYAIYQRRKARRIGSRRSSQKAIPQGI